MSDVKSYAADQVIVTWGPFLLTGFAPGDAIQIVRNADGWTTQRGIGGEVARSRMGDDGARITLSFLQTAAINAFLSAAYRTDRLNRDQIFPIMVKDNSGNSLHVGEECWIAKPPDSTYAEEAGSRDWIFEVAHMEDTNAGN